MKNSRPDDDFLYSFRDDLKKFMAANPVMEWSAERPNMEERLNMILNYFYYKINKTKLMPIAIVIALIAMLSGGGAALASQNSVPGETLYPVKTLTENVRSVLAIGGQSEAKLQSRLAAERLEEVNEMLQADEVDAEGVEIALGKLKEHVAKMSRIVEEEKTKGRDVAQLEDALSNNLKTNKDMLERTFKAQKEGIENEKKSLEKEIDAAESNDDENEINELEEKLNALKKKNELLEVKENAVKQEIKDDEDENEDEDDSDGREKSYLNLEWKLAAVKAMKEAEKEKNGLLSKASSSGVTIDGKYFKQYDDFMAKASSSLAIGDSTATSTATSTDAGGANYKQAYQFAKQAKEMLGLAEKEYERQDESFKKNEEVRKESDSKDDEDGNGSSDDQEENEDKEEDDKDEDDNSRR